MDKKRIDLFLVIILALCACLTYFLEPVIIETNGFLSSFDVFIFNRDRLSEVEGIDVISQVGGEWFMFSLPIIFTIVPVRLFTEELNTGTYRYEILRSSERRFFGITMKSFVTSAFLIWITSIVFHTLLSVLMFGVKAKETTFADGSNVYLFNLKQMLFSSSRILAVIFLVLFTAYILSVLFMNKYISIVLPFLIVYFLNKFDINIFAYLGADIGLFWVAEYALKWRARRV